MPHENSTLFRGKQQNPVTQSCGIYNVWHKFKNYQTSKIIQCDPEPGEKPVKTSRPRNDRNDGISNQKFKKYYNYVQGLKGKYEYIREKLDVLKRKESYQRAKWKRQDLKIYILNEKLIVWPYHEVRHERRKG